MSDQFNISIDEYHEEIFKEFWLKSYSPRIHHIDNSVGVAYDQLSTRFNNPTYVLDAPASFVDEAKRFLCNTKPFIAERAIAEYYEWCYRCHHSILDPATKIPVPRGLWKLTPTQTSSPFPIFQRECKWKKNLAKIFSWLFRKVVAVGGISLLIGIICLLDASKYGFGPAILFFSTFSVAILFLIIEHFWMISSNADFIGDIKYKITSNKKYKDFSETGVIKVANIYHHYVGTKYRYLSDIQRRVLSLYLTAVYFKPFLSSKKPSMLMDHIIKSCMSFKMDDIIKLNLHSNTFSLKFTQEPLWTTVCGVCADFFCHGAIQVNVDPKIGIRASDYEASFKNINIKASDAIEKCESDFAYIEPIMNETHSEERFRKIFNFATESIRQFHFYLVMVTQKNFPNARLISE